MSKLDFDREAICAGVQVDKYSTDIGIYTSKTFTRYMHDEVQGIKHSGVGGHNQNGVADNVIKNVVIQARTMMIHTTLRWDYSSEKRLCTMDMSHAVQLYNHTPHISSGLYPEEVWTKSKFSQSDIQDYLPWGCPSYVL